MPSPLLEIRNATKIYSTGGFFGGSKNSVVALDDFNLTIDSSPATITTIAGESGSGKTTLANLVLGFIRLTRGQIIYNGEDVTEMTDAQLKTYRRNVQAVFQDPFGVYNPFYRVDHIFELVNKHFDLSDNKTEYREMVEEGLNVVGLYGEDVLRKYPHQLSGGQRQRIMMARAYMIKPRLIVADEPVSMVDASLRASILEAMLRLRDDHNISFLYITHDLSTAYQIGDEIYMLYQGTTAERGSAMRVIDQPQHPYVQLLIDSVPVPDPTEKWDVNISLPSEEEMRVASAKGCRYYPRCPHRMDKCLEARPPLYTMTEPGHEAACYLYEDNEVALAPEYEGDIREVVAVSSGNPLLMMAGFVGIMIVALGLLFTAMDANSSGRSGGSSDDDNTSQVAVDDEPTAQPEEEPTSVPATEEVEEGTDLAALAELALTVDGATEKGALTIDEPMTDEITSEDEKHSYTFDATAGETVLFKVNAEGSAFTSPFGFVYNPDGEFVLPIGIVTERAKRSYRIEYTPAADGTYTIVVGPYDGSGIEEYSIVVESVEVTEDDSATDESTDTTTDEQAEVEEVVFPAILIDAEGATEKSALTLDEPAIDEITAEDEKHSYTYEGTAGEVIEFRVNAEGSAFTSPFGFVYGPDGEIVAAPGDPEERAKRSYRVNVTLPADGTYTIVVAPYDGSGIEEYAVAINSVEGAEAPADDNADAETATEDDTADAPEIEAPVAPATLIDAEGATEKTALTIDEPVKDEITADDEKHSYTYEGTAGDIVEFRVIAEGSAFTSPYGFMYGPDGEFVAAAGDPDVRAKRSWRVTVPLPADGTYTIVVAPYDGNGVEEYSVSIETYEE